MMAPNVLAQRISDTYVANFPNRTARRISALVDELDSNDLPALTEVLHSRRDLQSRSSDVAAALWVKLTGHRTDWDPDRSRAGQSDPDLTAWLTELRNTDDDNQAFELASSAITWQLRSHRRALLSTLTLGDVIVAQEERSAQFDTKLSILLQAARYDFDFKQIERIFHCVGIPGQNDSRYYRAMLIFSRLGQGLEVPESEIEDIVDATDSEKILSLLLHGLWFTEGRDQSRQMLRIGDKLCLVNELNPITHMRMASAYRRQGKFNDAINSINHAIELLPPENGEIHADLKLERVTIAIQQDATTRSRREIEDAKTVLAAEMQEQLDDAKTTLDTKVGGIVARTEAQLSDSLFKVVEILGLFTALIALIATVVGSATLGSGIPWGGRVAIIAAGGLVALGFFWLLRRIVQPASTNEAGQ